MDKPPETFLELSDITNNSVILLSAYHGYRLTDIKKYQNKIIIYALFGEYLRDDAIESILTNSTNYYIFLNCQQINPAIIKKYKSKATFIRASTGYSYYSKNLIDLSATDYNRVTNSIKTKHFLSLNNRASWPRLGLFYFFNQYDLLNKSYFSYIGDMERTSLTIEQIDDCIRNVWYNRDLDIDLIKKQIPLYTGLDNFEENDWSSGNIEYYQNAFCSIVTETYCFEEFPFFTEKIFKPIAFCQPFLVHGNPNSLKELQNMGFKTFNRWWDESYDELADHKRFEKILTVILEISLWSVEKINSVYQEMIPILEHNYKNFRETLPILYDKEIIKIKRHILAIINDIHIQTNHYTITLAKNPVNNNRS